MADQTNPNDGNKPASQAGNASPQQSLQERRKQLVEMEYGVQAIEMHMAALIEELRSLEDFTLTSLLARIRGDRDARIEETLQQAQLLQSKLDAAVAVVDAMRQDLGDRNPDFGDGGASGSIGNAAVPTTQADGLQAEGPAMNGSPGEGGIPTAKQRIGMLQRALDMCDETHKDLLRQMESAGSLDKCNTVNFNAVIDGMLGATTDHARKEMAEQVRNDLRRLLGRVAEAVKDSSTPLCEEELRLRDTLTRFESKFDGRWLMPGHPERGAIDELLQALSMTAIFLEKRLMDARENPSGE